MLKNILCICFSLVLLNCGETKETTTSKPITNPSQDTTNTIVGKRKDVKDYGAIGDGITDDTAAIQKALDDGDGTVLLSKKHKISASLINTNNNTITFLGTGKAEILTPNNSFYKIKNSANLKISEVTTSPPFIELIGDTDYTSFEVVDCNIIADVDKVARVKNYAVRASGTSIIQNITFSRNTVKNTTVLVFNKETSATNMVVKENTILNFKQFVIAMRNCDNIFVEGNTIKHAMQGTKTVRVLFRTGLKETHFNNNKIENIKTNVLMSVIYAKGGDLYFRDNVLKNINGKGNSYIISDKSSLIEKWEITNNVFDQTNIEEQLLNGIIKIGNNKAIIKSNIFKNAKSKAIQFGATKKEKKYSEISIVEKNQFIHNQSPTIISIWFTSGPVIIKNNVVNGMHNPLTKKLYNDASCRFVSVVNTKKINTIAQINISNNELTKIDKNASLLWVNTKNGGGMEGAFLANNTMDSGKQLVKYRNKETKPIIGYTENIMPNTMVLENIKNINAKKN